MSTRSKNSVSERSLTRKYKKEVDKLIFFANTSEESVFQSNFKYIQFKTKKILEKIVCYDFVNNLDKLEFHEESIFWYKKLLEETVCTIDEQYEILSSISRWYKDIDDNEKALEYGLKVS